MQTRELAPGVRDRFADGKNLICICGTWNCGTNRSTKVADDRCLSCHRPLYAGMSITDRKTTIIFKDSSKSLVLCCGWTIGRRASNVMDGCGKKLAISRLTYIQTHWYVAPYSCTGGDYWNSGEGQFFCPECKKLNRLYERPDVVELKHSFGAIKDAYEHH